MRVPIPPLSAHVLVALWAMAALHAQITSNPIPAPVEKRGLAVEIRDVVRLPDTRGLAAADRRRQPGRLGAGELRAGCARRPAVRQRLARAAVPARRRRAAVGLRRRRGDLPARRLQPPRERLHRFRFPSRSSRRTGCSTRFTPNGRRGTRRRRTSSRRGSAAADVTYHNVITEWRATSPAANTFAGSRRELLRVAHIVETLTHPMGNVEFNPTAKPGSAGLRPALHQRQRSRVQQRRRTAQPQSAPDAAARFRDHGDSADRSAQSFGDAGGPRGSATTRFRRRTYSPRTASRTRSARSTPTGSATRTACRGT